MNLDLELAASFLVLVDERHYGRAAARLHLTSPALTKRIQRLERQLGVALVARGPAGVLGVTAAGLRFAAAAGPLLAHATATCTAVRLRGLDGGERDGRPLAAVPFRSCGQHAYTPNVRANGAFPRSVIQPGVVDLS